MAGDGDTEEEVEDGPYRLGALFRLRSVRTGMSHQGAEDEEWRAGHGPVTLS